MNYKNTTGGVAFDVETSSRRTGSAGLSSRIAMNRPQRLVPTQNATVTNKVATPRSGTTSTTVVGVGSAAAGPGAALSTPPASPAVIAETGSTTLIPLEAQSSFWDGAGASQDGESPITATPNGNTNDTMWTYSPPPNNQRSFHFPEDGLYFSSEFDSGNLIQMERLGPMKYNLYSCPDCGNSPVQTNNRQWFHFAVRGASKGTVLQLQMVGLMNSKMYSFGWTPVAAVMPSRPVYTRMSTRVVVTRLETAPVTPAYPQLHYKAFPTVDAGKNGGDDGGDDDGDGPRSSKSGKKEPECVAMNVAFEYRFDCDVLYDASVSLDHPMCPAVYIASNHPYSFQRLQKTILGWQQSALAAGIYFHREVLCRSLDGRPVDLLTISGTSGMDIKEREPPYAPNVPVSCSSEGAVPEIEGTASNMQRAHSFPSKRYVLLTARVHPGEAPASHMLQGCMDFLMDSKDPRVQTLLQKYVFVVVPMINPDGVVRGHSRADTTGQNLNRMYRNPHPLKHPAIFTLRHMMLALQRTGRLALFIDMHAHANKKGAFFFGNAMSAQDQIQNLLYAKLVTLNTPHLEWNSCNFSASNMFAMGKNGETKDGSSRVTIFQETGFIHSYTIETSYVTGVVQNPIAANPTIPGEEIDILPGSPSPKYNQTTFADVGKALLVSLLDYHGVNPASRIPNGPHRTLKGVTQWIQRQLLYEVFESMRKQAALRAGIPVSHSGSMAGASQNAGNADRNSGNNGPIFNPDTATPLNLPLSAVHSVLEGITAADPVTTKSSKAMPPVTLFNLAELLAQMRRDQNSNAVGSSSNVHPNGIRSAPPLTRASSVRVQPSGKKPSSSTTSSPAAASPSVKQLSSFRKRV